MYFSSKLVRGNLIRRYKRFLADVRLDDGSVVVAHCTNTGSMKSCLEEGAEVYLSPSNSPKRKTKYTWEMIRMGDHWVGINTSIPNLIAYEAVLNSQIPGLGEFSEVKREVKFEDSRFDIFARSGNEKCFIEVKNVSLREGDYALFPDAVTQRGQKHLKTLMEVRKKGMRAVMLYIIQREDISFFAPARAIDPEYASLLKKAKDNGVEIIALQARVSPTEIRIRRSVPVML